MVPVTTAELLAPHFVLPPEDVEDPDQALRVEMQCGVKFHFFLLPYLNALVEGHLLDNPQEPITIKQILEHLQVFLTNPGNLEVSVAVSKADIESYAGHRLIDIDVNRREYVGEAYEFDYVLSLIPFIHLQGTGRTKPDGTIESGVEIIFQDPSAFYHSEPILVPYLFELILDRKSKLMEDWLQEELKKALVSGCTGFISIGIEESLGKIWQGYDIIIKDRLEEIFLTSLKRDEGVRNPQGYLMFTVPFPDSIV